MTILRSFDLVPFGSFSYTSTLKTLCDQLYFSVLAPFHVLIDLSTSFSGFFGSAFLLAAEDAAAEEEAAELDAASIG